MIMGEYFFKVAGFVFGVTVPDDTDIEKLLPSFRPFRYCEAVEKKPLFMFHVHYGDFPEKPDTEYMFIDESLNDMGRVRLYSFSGGYYIRISFRNDETEHCAVTDSSFRRTDAYINKEDRYAGEVVSSLLRMVYSQAIIPYGGISVHASSVILDGKAYLFMGKSGTGKSTHSRLWIKAFPGCKLMNDDNPTILISNDVVMAAGTPWSGKTSCYIDVIVPVGGIVKLKQALFNIFLPCDGVQAFINMLSGCSVIRKDVTLQNEMHRTLARVAELVTVGIMECLPDEDAAVVCRNGIKEKQNIKFKSINE